MKAELKIAWATHEATEYACKNWHYSKCVPSGKLVKIGVWEEKKFIGVVIFSRGASPFLMSAYGIDQTEGCELTRVALTKHITPVSRILSIALKFLKRQSIGLRLVVSFADPEQGHVGGIYKATNWVYTGTSGKTVEYFVKGKWRHVRGAYDLVKGENKDKWPTRERTGKHRYLYVLDDSLRAKILGMSRPYPTLAPEAEETMRLASSKKVGGASPTPALQSLKPVQEKPKTKIRKKWSRVELIASGKK